MVMKQGNQLVTLDAPTVVAISWVGGPSRRNTLQGKEPFLSWWKGHRQASINDVHKLCSVKWKRSLLIEEQSHHAGGGSPAFYTEHFCSSVWLDAWWKKTNPTEAEQQH